MKTVLLVDDDPAILALMHHVIASDGYAVLDAASADEALQQFEDNDAHVDLLITDVSLGSSFGLRVALELWSLLPDLRIVISSGYPPSMWPDQDVAELDEYPSDSIVILQKPFLPATLLDTAHRLIGCSQGMARAAQLEAASPRHITPLRWPP